MVKIKMLPTTNRAGVDQRILPDASVAIHANTWMPAGTLTAMLAAEKKPVEISGMPTLNMWCAHTPKLMKPVATIATTTSRYPTNGVCATVATIIDIIPAAGRKMM